MFAEKWQTLISGFLAIIAAFVGGAFINRQITASQRLEEAKRKRQFAAARAVMPLTLGEVIDFSKTCADALKEIHRQRDKERIPPKTALPALPPLLPTLVQGLRDTIEHADDEAYPPVADLLGRLQIIAARLRSLWESLPRENHVVSAYSIEGYIVDCAEVHARAALMFEFARRRSEAIKTVPRAKDIASSLRLLGFTEEEYERIHETVGGRFGNGASKPRIDPPLAYAAPS